MLIYETLEKLHASLLLSRHRSLVILDGSLLWAKQQIQTLLSHIVVDSKGNFLGNKLLTFSELESEPGDVNRKTYTHHLGTENQFLLFIDPDLNIDALAALAGTIASGGMCFVWLNTQEKSFVHPHFLSRFLQYVERSDGNYYLSEYDNSCSQISWEPLRKDSLSDECMTHHQKVDSLFNIDEQASAVKLICTSVTAKRRQPVVLTADRGRGKSTALALVCAELLISSAQKLNIVITAPNRAALVIFYKHLEQQLLLLNQTNNLKVEQHQGKFTVGANSIQYMPVDQLLKQSPDIDVLFVDEAAGVPVYLLKRMLVQFPTCVFSSTMHGYEGAGRGFSLKFLPLLKAHSPHFISLHLAQPIRWADNDPLETLLFDTCLLNAQLSDITPDIVHSKRVGESANFVPLSQEQLLQNEALLNEVFSVLVTAHYQTKPSDLKMLLDNNQVRVFALCSPEKNVLAVALTLVEGEVEPQLVQAIKQGKRRLKSHFLPQSILTHCVNKNAFDYRYLRIMRIAVHPSLQQAGLGTRLLNSIEAWAKCNEVDCLGTSFAATPEVCSFWFKNGYQMTRIGFNADASSGEHSTMMLKSVTPNTTPFVKHLNQDFYQSFDYLLNDEYQQLPVPLVLLVLAKNTDQKVVPSGTESKILAFVKGEVQYSCIVYELHQWLVACIASTKCSDEQFEPLVARILMKRSIKEVCQRYGFTGKKALNQYIIETVSSVLAAN